MPAPPLESEPAIASRRKGRPGLVRSGMQTFIKLGPERHGSVHTTRNWAHGTHFVHASLPLPYPAHYSRVVLNLRARRQTPIEPCARIFRTLVFQHLEHPGCLT